MTTPIDKMFIDASLAAESACKHARNAKQAIRDNNVALCYVNTSIAFDAMMYCTDVMRFMVKETEAIHALTSQDKFGYLEYCQDTLEEINRHANVAMMEIGILKNVYFPMYCEFRNN